MIGYATLGTNNIAAARTYYDALLGSIGAGRIMEFGDELGGFTMWGTSWEKPGLALTTPYDKNRATVGNGSMIALTVDTRDKVDMLYAKAIELGGTCEGPPGLRGDEGPQAFYGAYFRDLDGNKLCVFRTGPA